MPPAVQVGAILIEESPLMTQLLGLESEPYSGNWNLVKVLDGFAFDRKIRASGWNFFFRAAEEKAMFFGAPGARKIQNALKRILGKVKQQHFNSLEVTGIVARRFLGVPYTIVSAHSRHAQQSCYLDGPSGRPSATQNGREVECVSGPGSGLMKPNENQSLERILESATVVSWADLITVNCERANSWRAQKTRRAAALVTL